MNGWHCRMRSRSRALIAATYKSSAIDVVFGAQSIGNIRILTFQQGSTLKFLKYFWTLSFLNFGQCNGVMIFCQPIRKRSQGTAKKKYMWFVYWSLLWAVMPGRSCVRWPRSPWALGAYDATSTYLPECVPSKHYKTKWLLCLGVETWLAVSQPKYSKLFLKMPKPRYIYIKMLKNRKF